ncbi:MAG: TlpA family protein disulfide reductase [Deltaproteobacteria bacterium]|nr:TlpA family protein disulfide reductase [Deltaproteobacteria bacterium]
MPSTRLSSSAALFSTLIACFIFVAAGCARAKSDEPAGRKAPVFWVITLDGYRNGLEDNKGKVLVLKFWASWCGYCKREAAAVEKVWRSFKGRDVRFIGIIHNDSIEGVNKYIGEYGLTYPNAFDGDGSINEAYNVVGTPTTVVIGKDGRISFVRIGPITEDDLAGEISHAL